jgi:hypothetical protein
MIKRLCVCRWRLSSVFVAIIFSVVAFGANGTNAPGADIFAPEAPVLRIRVDIPRDAWRSLESDPRKQVAATVREGDHVYTNVMVHVKGAAGSFRDIGSNPSLTLSFGKGDQEQRFHGLHKIHLNNSVQDPSETSYCITSMMFNDAGVPAARVTNARFWLNGRDLGMYLLVEGFTKDFLRRYFKDTRGNFYDGGFLTDITGDLQRTMGDGDDNKADLRALAQATRLQDPEQRWERLQKLLDVDAFVNFMVIENFTWDWDGYMAKPNNYRLYHDPATGKITFIPHGMDQMFWEPHGSVWRPQINGMVARAIIETPEGAKLYHDRVKEVFAKAFKLDAVTKRFDQLTSRNRSAASEVGRGYLNHWEGAIADVRQRIVERWKFINEQIENEPKPMDFSKPALVKSWRQQFETPGAVLDQPELEGKSTLHIVANGHTAASWRSSVMLEPGKYRFEALARTAKLAALRDTKGEGAGIRISGSNQPRKNSVSGDAGWTKLQYDFEVQGAPSEVVLVCESRASRGDVWFDAGSLALEKLR